MNKIYIDFETRSAVNLKTVGTALYAEHPTTDVLCVAFAIDDGLIKISDWRTLLAWAKERWVIWISHNAFFEQQIYKNLLVKRSAYPEIPIEHWRCTMAKALAHGLPASLDKCAKELKLPIAKDMEGRDSMLRLSKPRKDGSFWTPEEKPEEFEKLYNYCKQDVKVMRLIDQTLPDLSAKEQKIWFIDQRINNEGIRIDKNAVEAAIKLYGADDAKRQAEFRKITGGIPNSSRQRGKLLIWLKNQGANLKDTQSSTITAILQNSSTNLPKNVRTVLNICQSSGKSSIAKYKKMLIHADQQGIVKGILQYYGAHTGRWSGRGIQIQNFPRPMINPDNVLEALIDEDLFKLLYANAPRALSFMLRRTVIAPNNHTFLGADFSQIEARVLAWLAGQTDVLEAFASGRDLYCEEASKIYGYEVTKQHKNERLVGKVAVLALGFGGGIGAFAEMSKGYGLDLSGVYEPLWRTTNEIERLLANEAYERFCRTAKKGIVSINKNAALVADIIKQRRRNGNKAIVNYWSRVEAAVRMAIQNSSLQSKSVFSTEKIGNRLFLTCRLPSGRKLYYLDPHISEGSIRYTGLDPKTKQFKIQSTYGGKLVENIVQAVARDIMAEAMYRLENKYPTAFTVHDELVCLSESFFGENEFKRLVLQTPKWAVGLPIGVETWSGDRYGK
jgi:DNA polymerase